LIDNLRGDVIRIPAISVDNHIEAMMTVDPSAERYDDAREILKQIILVIDRRVHADQLRSVLIG
jgi:hypothetical protein